MRKRIILFGFGNVGGGFYRLYQQVQAHLPAEIIAIVVRHKEKHPPSDHIYAYEEGSWREAWAAADIVIECTSDPVAGWEIIFSALRAGKAVITSSKRPLAENLSVLHEWLVEHPRAILRHEAAAIASLPVFGGIFTHFAMEPINALTGVVNGTTHYIVQQILREGRSYGEVLREAQRLGYAEEDPTLDVSGWDAAYKLILLLWRMNGFIIKPESIPVWGIQGMADPEISLCRRYGLTIKPIVQARRTGTAVELYVGPALFPAAHVFSPLEGAENGLSLDLSWAGRQFYQGMGAGPLATGSAILGDLQAILRGIPSPAIHPVPAVQPAGLRGIFYLRGEPILRALAVDASLPGDAALWQGDARTLQHHTDGLSSESYFVALVSSEAMHHLRALAISVPEMSGDLPSLTGSV